MFQHVFGPILLEITVKEDLHASYLQPVVGPYIGMLLAQTREDNDFLFKKLVTEAKLEIKVRLHDNLASHS